MFFRSQLANSSVYGIRLQPGIYSVSAPKLLLLLLLLYGIRLQPGIYSVSAPKLLLLCALLSNCHSKCRSISVNDLPLQEH